MTHANHVVHCTRHNRLYRLPGNCPQCEIDNASVARFNIRPPPAAAPNRPPRPAHARPVLVSDPEDF